MKCFLDELGPSFVQNLGDVRIGSITPSPPQKMAYILTSKKSLHFELWWMAKGVLWALGLMPPHILPTFGNCVGVKPLDWLKRTQILPRPFGWLWSRKAFVTSLHSLIGRWMDCLIKIDLGLREWCDLGTPQSDER